MVDYNLWTFVNTGSSTLTKCYHSSGYDVGNTAALCGVDEKRVHGKSLLLSQLCCEPKIKSLKNLSQTPSARLFFIITYR